MAVSAMVGTAKNLCNLAFLSLQKSRTGIFEAICYVINVMEITTIIYIIIQ